MELLKVFLTGAPPRNDGSVKESALIASRNTAKGATTLQGSLEFIGFAMQDSA